MTEKNSHRQILRSTSIIGGAAVFNVLLGLVRTKVAASLLGPAGIGLIGLLQNLMATASTVSALGFGNVGTRQIAQAVGMDDSEAVAAARRALFWGTLGLSGLGAGIFWLLRDVLALHLFENPSWARDVGWLAIGVLMTVAAGSQMALLNGLRRIGDIARVSVLSGVLSTLLSVGGLFLLGKGGMIAFVLAPPLAGFLFGHLYVARLPKVRGAPTPFSQLVAQWRVLVQLGGAFMVAGLAVTVGQLAVRTMIQREMGSDYLGQFQASWAISMTYIGFILTAMGTDYYPRLTANIDDPLAANRMVNEQTEVALLLASPLILIMLGGASWIIALLYSSHFSEAAVILRWQVLGDILKIASFPLAYIMLASGSGRTYMLAEGAAMLLFLLLTWFGLPWQGIQATGQAFVGMYAFYLALVYLFARRRMGFRWTARVRIQLGVLFAVAFIVHVLAGWREIAGMITGLGASVFFGIYAVKRLRRLSGSTVSLVERLRHLIWG